MDWVWLGWVGLRWIGLGWEYPTICSISAPDLRGPMRRIRGLNPPPRSSAYSSSSPAREKTRKHEHTNKQEQKPTVGGYHSSSPPFCSSMNSFVRSMASFVWTTVPLVWSMISCVWSIISRHDSESSFHHLGHLASFMWRTLRACGCRGTKLPTQSTIARAVCWLTPNKSSTPY